MVDDAEAAGEAADGADQDQAIASCSRGDDAIVVLPADVWRAVVRSPLQWWCLEMAETSDQPATAILALLGVPPAGQA